MSNPIEILQACQRRIESHASYNVERAAWYDAKQRVKSLDISIPRDIDARVETALGWPALVVDALEERLNINGFATATANREVEATLGRVWRDNDLDIEYSQAHLEALIHGVAFLCAQPGGDGDPAPTITVESPATMTGIWDPVRRELSAAAAFVYDDEAWKYVAATVWDRETCWRLIHDNGWHVAEAYRHGLGRVPVRRLVNRARAGRRWGGSEITPSIIAATRSTVRALTRVEVASEFFSAPELIALGLSREDFGGNDFSTGYTRMMAAMMLVPDTDEPDYQRPDIKQLPAASPTPIVELIRMYSQIVAGEAALPPAYLGFETANPSSADQIRAIEARHVKRAERKQAVFGKAWIQILGDGLELAGYSPGFTDGVTINWADAATPTRAATTDAIVKQVQAGVLPPTSPVTYEQLGYSPATIDRLVADARLNEAAQQAPQVMMSPIDAGDASATTAQTVSSPTGDSDPRATHGRTTSRGGAIDPS
nr:phage portal protein [Nanchangia anserum]